MSAPQPADDALARVEKRLERLESQLDRLVTMVETQGPAAATAAPDLARSPSLAMALDVVDEVVQDLSDQGVDLDARLRDLADLALELSKPRNTTAVRQLLPILREVAPLLANGPTVGMVLDTVDELIEDLRAQDVDIDCRLRALRDLALITTEPETVHALRMVIPRFKELAPLIDNGPPVGMVLDMFDDLMQDVAAEGVDLSQLVPRLHFAFRFGLGFLTSEAAESWVENMGQARTLEALTPLLTAAREAYESPGQPVGVLAAIGRLRDPRVQSSIGFLLTFAERLGDAYASPPQLSERQHP